MDYSRSDFFFRLNEVESAEENKMKPKRNNKIRLLTRLILVSCFTCFIICCAFLIFFLLASHPWSTPFHCGERKSHEIGMNKIEIWKYARLQLFEYNQFLFGCICMYNWSLFKQAMWKSHIKRNQYLITGARGKTLPSLPFIQSLQNQCTISVL